MYYLAYIYHNFETTFRAAFQFHQQLHSRHLTVFWLYPECETPHPVEHTEEQERKQGVFENRDQSPVREPPVTRPFDLATDPYTNYTKEELSFLKTSWAKDESTAMRLLDSASLCLSEFLDQRTPKYVILSHTWEEGEVTFQDIQDLKKAKEKKGFQKLEQCCKKAKSDGFRWIWIDTCCIDKSSSAELSEAINSMYQWYKDSQICYAYLQDVHWSNTCFRALGFEESRWFRRGWTLQELIAPSIVEFYAVDWTEIGTKLSLLKIISEITSIDERVLENSHYMDKVNVASRMSWAAGRKTTRKEDEAYCLMGIFGVNMALLYGEGRRAFYRLQEEIMDVYEDYTIFAWTEELGDYPGHANHELRFSPGHADGILAKSPANFQQLRRWPHVSPCWAYSELYTSISEAVLSLPQLADCIGGAWEIEPPTLTCRGLSISLPIRRKSADEHQACLTCTRSSTNTHFLCLTLQPMHTTTGQASRPGATQIYTTAATGILEFVPQAELIDNPFQYATIYLARSSDPSAIRFAALEPKVHAKRMVTVLIDRRCSISDSFVLWLHQDGDRNPRQHPKNEFFLSSTPLQLGISLQAVFRVYCHDIATPLIVAFGTAANNALWCDILSKRQIQDDETISITIDGVGIDGNDENESKKSDSPVSDTDLTQRGALRENSEAIKQLFQKPLRDTFKGATSYIDTLEALHNIPSTIRLFESTSDRVAKHFSGFTITVTARRAFESRDEGYTLSISVIPPKKRLRNL